MIGAMVDFEKELNRHNHYKLITKLSDMGVPEWLPKVVVGFLEGRTLVVSKKGEKPGV